MRGPSPRLAPNLVELRGALETFEGCPLRATATRLCFADGSAQARLMLIGEAPGQRRTARVGRSSARAAVLLDRMLAAIGLDRAQVWITNLMFWRPPGNRPPTATEVATCQPFLERQIELLAPAVILFLGGSAAKALLGVADGVTRLRGRRHRLPIRRLAARSRPSSPSTRPIFCASRCKSDLSGATFWPCAMSTALSGAAGNAAEGPAM